MDAYQNIVATGTYLYANVVTCDVRIVRSPIRYGSGDLDDEPEIRDDANEDTFYIWYGSTTQRDVFDAGGGGHPNLDDAKAQVVKMYGASVSWEKSTILE